LSPQLPVRAASVIGVALVGWSLNVRWGSGSSVRGGPPLPWERFVVGATALAALSMIAVWLATRRSAGASRAWLRGAACLLAAGAGAVALYLHREADRPALADLVQGPGWAWLTAGALVALASAAATFAVRAPPPPAAPRGKRRPR